MRSTTSAQSLQANRASSENNTHLNNWLFWSWKSSRHIENTTFSQIHNILYALYSNWYKERHTNILLALSIETLFSSFRWGTWTRSPSAWPQRSRGTNSCAHGPGCRKRSELRTCAKKHWLMLCAYKARNWNIINLTTRSRHVIASKHFRNINNSLFISYRKIKINLLASSPISNGALFTDGKQFTSSPNTNTSIV